MGQLTHTQVRQSSSAGVLLILSCCSVGLLGCSDVVLQGNTLWLALAALAALVASLVGLVLQRRLFALRHDKWRPSVGSAPAQFAFWLFRGLPSRWRGVHGGRTWCATKVGSPALIALAVSVVTVRDFHLTYSTDSRPEAGSPHCATDSEWLQGLMERGLVDAWDELVAANVRAKEVHLTLQNGELRVAFLRPLGRYTPEDVAEWCDTLKQVATVIEDVP